MKDELHSLGSFFLYRYINGKPLCTTSANVPLPKVAGGGTGGREAGEEMFQIIVVIEK